MQLTTEDKERIEQEFSFEKTGIVKDSIYFKGIMTGAEYATNYERQKEGERCPSLPECYAESKKLDVLEAERPDLLAKVSEQETKLDAQEKYSANLFEANYKLKEKVSEQEKEIERLKTSSASTLEIEKMIAGLKEAAIHYDEMAYKLGYTGLMKHTMTYVMLTENYPKLVSEQSQRIQQLEGLLKRVLQYNFEPRHPEHPVYKLIAEIKAALNP